MPGFRNSKKSRYLAAFEKAALAVQAGNQAIIRPETQDDYRTITNYWYDWRRIYYGVGIKSPDPAVRAKAYVVMNSQIKVDTDAKGRVLLRIMPQITPPDTVVEEVIRERPAVQAFSTLHGDSAPVAARAEEDRFLVHTKPWQDWFKARMPLEGMLRCLDLIPRDKRANPDLPSIDDLPDPASAEAEGWRTMFLAKGVSST